MPRSLAVFKTIYNNGTSMSIFHLLLISTTAEAGRIFLCVLAYNSREPACAHTHTFSKAENALILHLETLLAARPKDSEPRNFRRLP